MGWNKSVITDKVGIDNSSNETTWGERSNGESYSDLTGSIIGKPGITKSGKISTITDENSFQTREYIH